MLRFLTSLMWATTMLIQYYYYTNTMLLLYTTTVLLIYYYYIILLYYYYTIFRCGLRFLTSLPRDEWATLREVSSSRIEAVQYSSILVL